MQAWKIGYHVLAKEEFQMSSAKLKKLETAKAESI